MRKILIGILLVLTLTSSAAAAEISAPVVPRSGLDRMPKNTDSFGSALLELLDSCGSIFTEEFEEAVLVSYGIVSAALLLSVLTIISEKATPAINLAGVAVVSAWMFRHTDSLIVSASETVYEICEYGKLLCPVLTTALAAQGGVTASAALYSGTIAFITLLSMLVSGFFIPMVHIYLALSVSHSALGDDFLKKIADGVRSILSWSLKTMLIVFTTYMSITGVISGTTDAAALKAAKITISTVIPVVGGILSDASESVLVSMGIVKNAAGIYGILAVFAVCMSPFIKVGIQYLLLKASAAICGIFGNKRISALVDSFSAAMGLLLAMLASGSMMVLISTVCFLKGRG